MGGGCILYISPCQPLHALVYPVDCLSNSLSQHQSNSQAELSKPTREDFKISKRKRTRSLSEYIPIYQSSLQCDFCKPNHLLTRPVFKGRASPPGKTFSTLKKCLGHIVCMTIVFVHAIDVKFGPPSENSSPPPVSQAGYGSADDCWSADDLVTSVSYATQLSLIKIKIFRFNIKFY